MASLSKMWRAMFPKEITVFTGGRQLRTPVFKGPVNIALLTEPYFGPVDIKAMEALERKNYSVAEDAMFLLTAGEADEGIFRVYYHEINIKNNTTGCRIFREKDSLSFNEIKQLFGNTEMALKQGKCQQMTLDEAIALSSSAERFAKYQTLAEYIKATEPEAAEPPKAKTPEGGTGAQAPQQPQEQPEATPEKAPEETPSQLSENTSAPQETAKPPAPSAGPA